MSDLDNAINSINASAAKAENTATFLDDMSTFDDQSSVTNPNNGQTVASIPKQVKDRTDELFTAAESDINQAVSDAAQSATDAQDAADSIGRYQGLWPDSGGSADKGDTYQTQVSGTPTGQYFTALQNTTVDPVGDDVNWRGVVSVNGLAQYTDIIYKASGSNSPVENMISGLPIPATLGDVIETSGRYDDGDGGGGVYDVVSSGTADGYCDIQLDNGFIAQLRLSDAGFADVKQVGVKVFDAITDPDFESVDAGVILNALNSSRVLGLKSSTYGKVHLKTQYIDEKGMYFVAPKPSRIDTSEESSFDVVIDDGTVFSNPAEGPFVIKSGVRRGGIVGVVLTEGAGATFSKLFSFGDARYNDDTSNIISNYYTDAFYTRGGDYGFFAYQYFNCQFINTQNRDFRLAAWWNEEGGTSCHWLNCFPLSGASGAKGFVWNPDAETQGHIYSTMVNCAPQLVSHESYIFRNCGMTLTSCGEEFSSYESDSTMLFVGTGNYTINNYSLVHRNTDKPKNIYGVTPTPSGRFGATLTINGTNIGVTSFSGDKVGLMYYGSTPTSILSTAKWDISNTNQKCDPTSVLDYDTWRSGYYYNNFVILKAQLEEIETYTRSGQNTAIIGIDQNTRHTITGEITTASGSAYVTFEVDTGNKTLDTASRVDVIATATADSTNRGKILHIDTGLDQTYSTGNVYLRSFSKATVDIFASFSGGFLRVEFESGGVIEGQTGIWTITRRRSANL